ncbi:hypothetical protein EZS27_039950, partial [termite gut metagenome]
LDGAFFLRFHFGGVEGQGEDAEAVYLDSVPSQEDFLDFADEGAGGVDDVFRGQGTLFLNGFGEVLDGVGLGGPRHLLEVVNHWGSRVCGDFAP